MENPKNYSQLNQDVEIALLYGRKRGGYFVEVGAHNGIHLSNTKMLEESFGWNGVCAEPNPNLFKELVKNRTAYCSQKAVYSTSGETLEFLMGTDDANHTDLLSGITKTLMEGGNLECLKKENVGTIKVETITLTKLLDEAKMPRFIEYLSIDVEGAEMEVLNGIDFFKYAFGRIDVEHNYQEPHRTNMRTFLEGKGYSFFHENQWDDAYIHSALIPKKSASL